MRKMNYSDMENVNGGWIGFYLGMCAFFAGVCGWGIHKAKRAYDKAVGNI